MMIVSIAALILSVIAIAGLYILAHVLFTSTGALTLALRRGFGLPEKPPPGEGLLTAIGRSTTRPPGGTISPGGK